MTTLIRSGFVRALALASAVLLSACQTATPQSSNASTPEKLTGQVAKSEPCPPEPTAPKQQEIEDLVRQAKDRGVLYRLSKNGLAGYLYGTIHISRREWLMPGPKTLAALKGSNLLALEVNVFDPEIKKKAEAIKSKKATTVQMPPEFDIRIDQFAKRVCAPIEKIRKQSAGLLLPSLVIFDARFEGLEASFGSEVMLYGIAKGRKMPVESLETIESQLGLFNTPSNGNADQRRQEAMRLLSKLERGESRADIAKMASAWSRGDLDAILKVCPDCTAESMKKLNDDRNPGMAAGIDKLISAGKVVFTGVGVLHMVGPKALPKLLEEKGYRVEREF